MEINSLKSLTGVITLPDVRFNFYLSFDKKEEPENDGAKGDVAREVGQILDRASELSPDLQKLLVEFAEFLAKMD